MKNSHKNNNKTPQHRSVYRRHPFQFIFITLLVVAGLGSVTNTLYGNWHDERNVTVMRSTMAALKFDLAKDRPNATWQDKSHCTIIEPRLFGESTTYSCTSEYTVAMSVNSQDDIDGVLATDESGIKIHKDIYDITIGHRPSFTTDRSLLELPSYQKLDQGGAIGFSIKNVDKRGSCAMLYELDADQRTSGVQLKTTLTCSVDTKRTYFNPIETI